MLDDADARVALDAERAVVVALGGGCQMPIGAHATLRGDIVEMTAVVVSPDGARAVRAEANGPRGDAERIGHRVAAELRDGGAGEILEAVERAQARVSGLQP
jgi:hydroxymethylbilane synthase